MSKILHQGTIKGLHGFWVLEDNSDASGPFKTLAEAKEAMTTPVLVVKAPQEAPVEVEMPEIKTVVRKEPKAKESSKKEA